MSELIPNLEPLIKKLDKDSLALEMASSFGEKGATVESVRERLRLIIQEKMASEREEYGQDKVD